MAMIPNPLSLFDPLEKSLNKTTWTYIEGMYVAKGGELNLVLAGTESASGKKALQV